MDDETLARRWFVFVFQREADADGVDLYGAVEQACKQAGVDTSLHFTREDHLRAWKEKVLTLFPDGHWIKASADMPRPGPASQRRETPLQRALRRQRRL